MWKFGRLGSITVPALIGRDRNGRVVRLMDSMDIARFADSEGKEAQLFSDKNRQAIQDYNDLSEKALDAGRMLLMDCMSRDKAVRLEAVPKIIPNRFRLYCDALARLGLWFVQRSFARGTQDVEAHRKRLVETLTRLREDLKVSGGEYLLGSFSYADVTMAVVLQCVKPYEGVMKSMGPLLRKAWGDRQLQNDFADLRDWRDRLYRKHRPNRVQNHP